MLNFDIKRKINTLRDILVGKVPDPKAQVEQITIALIYKFMDDMDIEGMNLAAAGSFLKKIMKSMPGQISCSQKTAVSKEQICMQRV